MNTLAYILYLLITYVITVHVGLAFYRNGYVYILQLLHGNTTLATFINRMLLTGYYLLNLGYVALSIQSWKTITSPLEILTSICSMTGKIMLTLAIIHFVNMAVILLISRAHRSTLNTKL